MQGKVSLLVPPSSFLLDERVFPSLGILKVASALEQREVAVQVLDLAGVSNFCETLDFYLRQEVPDFIGITATTPQMPAVRRMMETIRAVRPGARVILGGPHVTLLYAALKGERRAGIAGRATRKVAQMEAMFDVLCTGDGERAIFRALGDNPGKVIDADEMKSGLFLSDHDFETTPWPARHLISLESYHYSIEGRPATSVIAQLGCPFGCGFCGGRASKSLRVTRQRSPESVVAEIEFLHRTYGYTGFMFYDDELNVSKTVVELMDQLAALQDRLGVEFRLRGFVKAELFTDQQARAMYRAGFRWLLCGFEAAHPRILENIEKRATADDNSRVVEIARRHGLKVKALMSVGHPGESEETIDHLERWLIAHAVDDFDCTVITAYPGTYYYDLAVPHDSLPDVWTYTHKRTGDRLHLYDVDFTETAEYYKGDPNDGYRAYVFTDHLSSTQLVDLRNRVEANVRRILGIPYNVARPALQFEHSMGQGIPASILRMSAPARRTDDARAVCV